MNKYVIANKCNLFSCNLLESKRNDVYIATQYVISRKNEQKM